MYTSLHLTLVKTRCTAAASVSVGLFSLFISLQFKYMIFHLFICIIQLQDVWKTLIREKLVAKLEFDNPMDKHAVKVVLGNKTVSHLPRELSRIAWYFLARSGEISVKVIGRR